MKLSELFTDEDAVSPVIGVILMVAITVILAAVIGAFVLNIGGSQDTAPSASMEFEFSDPGTGGEEVTITHQSGASITPSTIEIKVGGFTAWKGGGGVQGSYTLGGGSTPWSSDPIKAGQSITLVDNADGGTGDSEIEDGEDIKVVWSSPKSDKSSVIGSASVGF